LDRDWIKIGYSYLKEQMKFIFLLLGLGGILGMDMFLNEISIREIGYGIGIYLFLVLIILLFDFFRFYKRYQTLKEAEETIILSLERLPEPKTLLEREYQDLLKLLMKEKRKNQNETEQKSRELGIYHTMWVHQIKTPISALRLLLQEKRQFLDLEEEQYELFEIERYVEMSLQYIRLDSESTDFLIRSISLDSVIREAIRSYAGLFIRKKIRLNYTPISMYVVTDEKWLYFVLGQLLSNAIKYTSAGSISIYKESDFVLVIEDTGIGIRAEDLPRVFEKGYTGCNGHTDKGATGIGLYLCKKVLTQLSHQIILESIEGKGTKVKIIFNHL